MSTIKTPATPALFDIPIQALNQKLKQHIEWIVNTYGAVQHLTTQDAQTNRVKRFPGIYTGDGRKYYSLLPDEDKHENYAYWDLDPYKIDQIDNQLEVLHTTFGLIIWFNAAKVLEPTEHRNLESIKEDVLEFFRESRVQGTRLKVTGVTDRNNEIFQGFNIKEVDQQHLMHPYAALRFNGTIRYERLCP